MMSPETDQSHLFVVRLWKADRQNDAFEYRGRVQHVLSGETLHFRHWEMLIEFLLTQTEQIEEFDE